MNVVVKVSRNA